MPRKAAKQALNDSKNSLCREIGHKFCSTTSNNYRVCSRAHCGAAQRLHNGAWVDVPKPAKAEKHEPETAPTMTVFDACKNIGVQCHGETLPRTSLPNFWAQGMRVVVCGQCGKPWMGTYCRYCGSQVQPEGVQA